MNKDGNKHTTTRLPYLDQTVEYSTVALPQALPQNERNSNGIRNFSEIMPIDQTYNNITSLLW